MNVIAVLARQASLVATKQRFASAVSAGSSKALASQVVRLQNDLKMFATLRNQEVESDVNDYESHRFQQDLSDMYTATISIEKSLEQLKEARAQHLKMVEEGELTVDNLNHLLNQASQQEAVMSNQLAILRENMMAARRVLFAVDGPDGMPDAVDIMNQREVNQIIDFASEHEDVDKIIKEHQKDREDRKLAAKTIAVDAPDGISDDEVEVDMQAVREMIDFAADHEDTAKVIEQHNLDDEMRALNEKVLAVDAPDGMSDDEFEIDLEAVENIIDFAAEHEDAEAIVLRHERERRDYLAQMNRIRDENSW